VEGIEVFYTPASPASASVDREKGMITSGVRSVWRDLQTLSPASSSALESTQEHPLNPKNGADWEFVKPLIEELYIQNNVRLKDVIDIMRTKYNFEARRVYFLRSCSLQVSCPLGA
jgi:hypothetical protein